MPTISEEIIIRSLQKTASAEETEILNNWLKEDKENVKYYFQLEEIWLSGKELPEITLQRGWDRLAGEIERRNAERSIPVSVHKTKKRLWLRYAAAVFAGVIAASALWMNVPSGQTGQEQKIIVQNRVYNQTGVQAVLLPDGSEVWLNENSNLVYPDEFADGMRRVSLEGKAYFSVSQNQAVPFTVSAGDIEVEVTGTEFFVDSTLEDEAWVTLLSGKVHVNYKDRNDRDLSIPLIPGQQVCVNYLNESMEVSPADTEYYVAWKDGTYRFDSEPLETIIDLLAKRYDVDIQIASSLRNKQFTGRVTPEENIQDVLITLHKSYPIHYQIMEKTVIISEL